jgi:uncharacterized protein (UPF0248 family)
MSEEWRRLPLPGNYQVMNIVNLVKNFPKDSTQRFSCLIENKSQHKEIENISLSDISSRNNALSSFGKEFLKKKKNLNRRKCLLFKIILVIGNPFDIKSEKGPKLSNKLSAKIPDVIIK